MQLNSSIEIRLMLIIEIQSVKQKKPHCRGFKTIKVFPGLANLAWGEKIFPPFF